LRDVVIVSACRTPVAKFQGALSGFRAPDLGALAIAEALLRAKVPASAVDEVIFGNVLTAGLGQNPARQAAIKAGIPNTVPSFTVNKVCGSGLKSVMLAAQAIRAGDAEVIVAGGQESMTNAPYLLPEARAGVRLGHGKLIDSMVWDGLWDIYNDFHMGNTGELVAKKYEITRRQQDEFAAASHQKAGDATKNGRFDAEKFKVMIPQRKGDPIAFANDEFIKAGTTADSIAGLRPAFKKDGSVTAANASGINDGGAAVLVMSASKAKALGLKPLALIKAFGTAGIDPAIMGMGPVPASKIALQRANWKPSDLDLMEINEAFAAQACAVNKEMGWDTRKINVNGGAIALGHPLGCSGARLMSTLLNELERSGGRYGLQTMCEGGGMANATILERLG
jgi:acetyl-CoA C-acetyltransferase